MNALKPFPGDFSVRRLRRAWEEHEREWWLYGTWGEGFPFSPAPMRNMGEIEKSSQFRPGVRCASLSDAYKLYYGLTSVNFPEAQGSQGKPLVEGWRASGMDGFTLKRYVNRSLWEEWYGETRMGEWGEEFYVTRPYKELTTRKEIMLWSMAGIDSMEGRFSEMEEDGLQPTARGHGDLVLLPYWYWETSGGKRTGAVYVDVNKQGAGYYYRKISGVWVYYRIMCRLGCQPTPDDSGGHVYRTFTLPKQACGVSFEVYGCYYANVNSNAGRNTPYVAEVERYYSGEWSGVL